ncbi:MAG TPA: GNAT family N-acetyltransferase, partial [Candidatus Krumholzibacteria bacterium]|nr:GNAT family N-acetyltransferase [Candidatus Krumholzibacteria bacterium]
GNPATAAFVTRRSTRVYSRAMPNVRRVRLDPAATGDASTIAGLRNHAADELTREFGQGHWSSHASERGVLAEMKRSRVYVVRRRGVIIATLALQTRKPWAIDASYFTPCKHPLYLTNMAVSPQRQRIGIGRACLDAARVIAHDWPADCIRLDAYDAEAGAGEFYAQCGFREVGRAVYRSVGLVYYELIL